MTFWHSLASFKVHLAHLPSPVMVTVSSAAAIRVAATAHTVATLAAIASNFFIHQPFHFELRSSASLTNIKDKPALRPVQFKRQKIPGKKFGWSLDGSVWRVSPAGTLLQSNGNSPTDSQFMN